LRALHLKQPIDVIEFAEVNAEGFFFAYHPIAPFVVRCHTPTAILARYYERAELPFDTRVTAWCEKQMLRRAHALTAPSHDMAQVIAKEYGLPDENIAVIPNALSLNEFPNHPATPSPNRLTILHVGRLERVKGVVVLASAIPRVVSQVPNAQFVFVGGDRLTVRGISQRAEIESALGKAQVLSHAEFLGEVDHATLMACYQRADICVVPSMLYESFSYTCAQTMAAGKPVVASRIGGIPETVDDGMTGLLVAPGDSDELADAIIRLAREPARREQMGRAGREKVAREFDPINIALRNLEVYGQAGRRFGRKDASFNK
jgi:glycosyltransferase involved in cell wall biosynthesis